MHVHDVRYGATRQTSWRPGTDEMTACKCGSFQGSRHWSATSTVALIDQVACHVSAALLSVGLDGSGDPGQRGKSSPMPGPGHWSRERNP